MSEIVYPDGYSEVPLPTGSRMWVGPEGVVIHAEPVLGEPELGWTAKLIDGNDTVEVGVRDGRLDKFASFICRALAGRVVAE